MADFSATTNMAAAAGGNRVIVVGGGLAGVCAAHAVLEHGGTVLLLDKSAFLGGNSTKASSGIAGTPTEAQIRAGVLDGVTLFAEDMNRSYHSIKKTEPVTVPVPPLVMEMARLSGSSLDWLVTNFGCDLSVLGLLGGHSKPRTHRGTDKMPGMAITYALISALEKEQKKDLSRVRIIPRARVVRLLREPTEGCVTGVVYEDKAGQQHIEYGAVVIATGGFAADAVAADAASAKTGTTTSLLARFAPQLSTFPTTNGAHATGDGVKMAEQIGAGLVDMELVQVHPTGLVDPKDPNNHVKFLCAEATRGAGGIIVDRHGRRFVDELGRRDEVSGAMLKHRADTPFYLILNAPAAREMANHCTHYEARGLMTPYANAREFCEAAGVSAEELARTFEQYKTDAKENYRTVGVGGEAIKTTSGGGGGFFAALFGRRSAASATTTTPSSGGSATGKPDRFGKTIFRNALSFDMNRGAIHVAQVCPVVHYTMGGLRTSTKAEVLDSTSGKPIPGLYCAGEAIGGIHGKNRLGGNSLLDCVVFGRVAGTEATRYLLSTYMGPFSNNRLNVIYRQLKLEELSPLPPVPKTSVADIDKSAAATAEAARPAGATAAAVPPPPAKASAGGSGARGGAGGEDSAKRKKFTVAGVAKHNKSNDCWCIIHGQVLDLTSFLEDHPGGKQSILMYAGKDATAAFDLVHQIELIEKYTPDAVVGVVEQ